MKPFTRIPFFRILIPLISGIFFGIYDHTIPVDVFYLILLFIPLTFFTFYRAGNRYYKWLFMLNADLFIFMMAYFLVQLKDAHHDPNYYGKQLHKDSSYIILATVSDLPIPKEKFSKYELDIKKIKYGSHLKEASGSVKAYIMNSVLTKRIKAGDLLLIKSRLIEISEPKNPYEFNYKNYLQHKQIYHTLFIDSNSFKLISGTSYLNRVWAFGLSCKAYLLSELKNSELNENAYAICAALLCGYDDEIDKSVLDAFSHSGTLHVLSVSGLHTGLIYMVLNLLFDVVDKKRKYKLLRFFLITVLLWCFALITGFSAPVLRAVIMFNLLGAGKLFFRSRRDNQINILCVSAFLLLFYDPYYILDTGFQLSYLAMFGLLFFQPALANLWQPTNTILNYTWQSVCASFAATLSTLPLTLFYFKQFPLWFFICNIIVVPATFFILILAFLLVFKLKGIALFINMLIEMLTKLIMLFNNENIGYIDKIDFTFYDLLFLFSFIILLSLSISFRSFKYLIVSLVLIVSWQLLNFIEILNKKNSTFFTLYEVKDKAIYSLKNKTELYLNSDRSQQFNYSVKPHLISMNNPHIHIQTFNSCSSEKHNILILDAKNKWPRINLNLIDILILCNNYRLTEHELKLFGNLKTLVLNSSNNNFALTHAEQLSRKFGIEFYNTKQKGAYLLPIP